MKSTGRSPREKLHSRMENVISWLHILNLRFWDVKTIEYNGFFFSEYNEQVVSRAELAARLKT